MASGMIWLVPWIVATLFVRMLPFVVSYLIRDGHLFLALKLDSGIYEFAPVPPKAP